MPRLPKPYRLQRRVDSKSFLLSLNATSGLPERVCGEWKRNSFQNLAQFREPRSRSAAEAAATALISWLKNTAQPRRVESDKITAGAWLANFASIEKSPKAASLTAEGRPYSFNTL
jgi:hypothetical protein